jgi:signal transduction histidine kinase
MRPRRWLPIAVPVVVIGVIEALSDSILDELLPFPRDTIVVTAVVAAAAAVGGVLAWRAIDHLTAALEAHNRELEARAAAMAALHQAGLAIATLADLDAILGAIVDSARRLLDADIAVLARTGADGDLRLAARSGPAELLAADTGDGVPSSAADLLAPEAHGAVLEAPLRRRHETVGALAVGCLAERPWGVDEIETLASLATQASIAIESARLEERLREMAVVGERERIARELHDGLAQVLGYVNTKSQAVEGLLEAGRTDEARAHLDELAAAARSVYVDVREAILGLSTPELEGTGLVGTLDRYGTRFAEAAKLVVRVEATAAARHAELPPAVEAQAFRIVQEALTNVRKHASARRVTIAADVRDATLHLEVRDDGRGLDEPSDPGEPVSGAAGDRTGPGGWPRYGLTSMRERAASVGGSLALEPDPLGGAVVRLAVPLTPAAAPR